MTASCGTSSEEGRERFAGTKLACNADMGPNHVRRLCMLDKAGQSLLCTASERLGLMARVYHRLLKVARTIADLAGSDANRAGPSGGGVAVSAATTGVTAWPDSDDSS